MAGLLGEHEYQMDSKGRISLPGKFRAAFEDGVYLTLGQDSCLYAFPREEWERRQAELGDRPLSDQKGRAYARVFFGKAEQAELDSQGRLVVPRRLRETVGIDREVTVVGVSQRLEIWATDSWADYLRSHEGAYASGALIPEA